MLNNHVKKSDVYEFFLHLAALFVLILITPNLAVPILFFGLILPDFLWIFYFFGIYQEKTLKRYKRDTHIITLCCGVLMLALGFVTIFLACILHLVIDICGNKKGGVENGKNENGKGFIFAPANPLCSGCSIG